MKWIADLCTPERVRRYPAAIAAMFLAVWLAGFALFGLDAQRDASGKFIGNDFVAFYTGGRFLIEGRTDALYDLSAQHRFQQSLTALPLEQTSPFISPPHATLFYAPFAAVGGYRLALLLWWAAGLLCFVVSAIWARGAAPGLKARPLWQLLAVLGCAPPTLLWLGYGQATPFVFAIWSGAYALLTTGRPKAAGCALALLAFKPQLALGLVVVLIARRQLAALALGATVLGGFMALNALCFPEASGEFMAMGDELLELVRAPSYPAWGVCSLYGFFNLLIYPLSANLSDALTGLSSLAMLAALFKLWWPLSAEIHADKARRAEHARIAITLALAPTLAMQYYTYDVTLAVLPLWIVIGLCEEERGELKQGSSPYLDGGPILAWTALLFIATFAAPPALAAWTSWTQARFGISWGVQPIPLLLIGWSHAVWRRFVVGDAGLS